jgi:hypothetical protein
MAKSKTAILKEIIEEDNDIALMTEDIVSNPLQEDQKWSDYVMTLFAEDELSDGKPRVHGLRRIARKILGPLQGSSCYILDTPSEYNGRRYVANYSVRYNDLEFSDIGDCSLDDKKGFSAYPAALATTRAEARVLRKLLGIVVCSAEEITDEVVAVNNDKPFVPDTVEAFITQQQINYITNLCKKLKIDLTKFVKQFNIVDFAKTPTDVAETMITQVNKYMQEGVVIPENLLKG